MFTGLIEEIGRIEKITPISGGKKIKISASLIMDDLKIDDSVAVNGVCLTATEIEPNGFWVDAVGETLTKSTLRDLQTRSEVNLERALKLSDRLGGHIVQGHVNGIGRISGIIKRGLNYLLEVDVPSEVERYLIPEGSIAIDGISLTIAQLHGVKVGISVIPHTWANTILKNKNIGDYVNLEVDFFAKYIEKYLSTKNNTKTETFSDDWFKEKGY